MSDHDLIRRGDALRIVDEDATAAFAYGQIRALPAVSPGVTPEAEAERVFMDAVWDVTGFRGTPEQLMNALSEMVRREPRQMQGAILRAALSALTAANARADAAEAALAKAVEFAEIVEKCGHGALWDLSRTTLAEIKGESHE